MICCQSQWEWGWVIDIITDLGEGHCRLWKYNNEECYWISDLFCIPSFRREGIATALLDKCDYFVNPSRCDVKVMPVESWQKRWYKKRGYKIVEESK